MTAWAEIATWCIIIAIKKNKIRKFRIIYRFAAAQK